MKVFIIALFMALNSYAIDHAFVVENYKEVLGMDFQVELVVKDQELDHRLLLDCQSFINGLHYSKWVQNRWNDKWFLMLEGNDCEDAANYSKGSIDKMEPFCMAVSLEKKQVDFYSSLSDCK